MSGQESFCFSTLPHHPAGRRQTCRTRLSVDKSIEATTPHGPATWLASCVLGVARRFECSEVAQTGYGACASDRRSVGAWTERAPNHRGREGVKVRKVQEMSRSPIRCSSPSETGPLRGVGGYKTLHLRQNLLRGDPEGTIDQSLCQTSWGQAPSYGPLRSLYGPSK